MNGCEKYAEMISALIDDELSSEDEALLRAHMDTCPDCASLYEAMKNISELTMELPEMPENLHEDIMGRIKEIADEDEKQLSNMNPMAISHMAQVEAMKSRPYRIVRSCVYGAACLVLCSIAIASSVGHRSDAVAPTTESKGARMTMTASAASMAAAEAPAEMMSEETYALEDYVTNDAAICVGSSAEAAAASPMLTIVRGDTATCELLDADVETKIAELILPGYADDAIEVPAEIDFSSNYTDAFGYKIALSWTDEEAPLTCSDGNYMWTARCSLSELLELIEE